jgi:hypothetical protein
MRDTLSNFGWNIMFRILPQFLHANTWTMPWNMPLSPLSYSCVFQIKFWYFTWVSFQVQLHSAPCDLKLEVSRRLSLHRLSRPWFSLFLLSFSGRFPQDYDRLASHPSQFAIHIVAYLLKARTVKPEKQPLLAKGSETTFASNQRPRNRQRNDVRY